MKPTKPTKKQRAHWSQTVANYRARHRQWVMAELPTMDDAQWKEYTAWVAAFGNQTRGRRVKRQLKAARETRVTATVTDHWNPKTIQIRALKLARKVGPV